jgi:hypothetical protein
LLAQKVLAGKTRGYRHHPQLVRFRAQADPTGVIASFLDGLAEEAQRRGYRFDTTKILERRFAGRIAETYGQLHYEWGHLKAKLRVRAPEVFRRIRSLKTPEAHPLFRIVRGGVRDWERR